MTAIWKPTQAQCDLIRRAAAREVDRTSRFSLTLRPGLRYNTERNVSPASMNIALISNEPDWDDTDLFDFSDWATFRKGVPLTEDGRAIVDFYVRDRNEGELLSNISLDYAGGKIVRIYGYSGLGDFPAEN